MCQRMVAIVSRERIRTANRRKHALTLAGVLRSMGPVHRQTTQIVQRQTIAKTTAGVAFKEGAVLQQAMRIACNLISAVSRAHVT